MIYLDSCALVKLVAREPESDALAKWLRGRQSAGLATSKLAEVELPRALRRNHPGVLGAVAGVLGLLFRVDINDAVRATAGAYVDPTLRSLDAIHLATADNLVAAGKTISAFVTYDNRLADAARQRGLTVEAPA